MFKQILKVLIALMLSVPLITFNALAFHKNGKIKQVYEDSNLTKEQISSKYCALKVTPWKEKQTEGSDFISQVEKEGQLGWNIESYHGVEKVIPPKKWDFSVLLNNNIVKLHKKKLVFLKTSQFIPDDTDEVKYTGKSGVTLEEFLKIICLQYDNGKRASKFSKTKSPTMYELFSKIAEDNKLIDKNGKPNLKAKLRHSHLKNGLKIDQPNTVYYLPDYLIAENNAIEQAKIDHSKKIKTENDTRDFIAGVKPGLIKEIKEKREKYDQEIKDINNKYTKLN